MAKEQFFHRETQPLFKKLEQLSQRSNVSRAQAFEDWLTAVVCILAAETKEDDYLAMVQPYISGKQGKRGVDLMKVMWNELIDVMTETDGDILGDLFQGAITYGEAGQYLTPECITQLMAQLSVDPDARPSTGQPLLIADPCCGTGRMLLEASKVNPHAELVGQDIDARCVKITAINLGLRSRYGWVVCGNSLSGETQFAYRIGHFFHESPNGLRRGVIRDVPPEQTPVSMLAKRTRSDAGDLFEQDAEANVPAAKSMPSIIEVPPWLARLEPALNALDRDKQAPPEKPAEPPPKLPNEPPPKQQTLF